MPRRGVSSEEFAPMLKRAPWETGMASGTRLTSFWRLARTTAKKAYPTIRLLLVLGLALSMAEFVAIDAGLFLAADLMLYLEIMLGAWAVARFARFMPGLPATVMLLPYRLFEPAAWARWEDE